MWCNKHMRPTLAYTVGSEVINNVFIYYNIHTILINITNLQHNSRYCELVCISGIFKVVVVIVA